MKKYFILMLLLVAWTSISARDTWLFVRPINFYYDPAKLFVLTDLLKQELQVQKNISVKIVDRPENGPDLETDAEARKDALKQTQTDIGFSGKISQIESTVFIYIYKWNSSGAIVYQERTSVPVGDDPEAIVNRLARCLITHEKFVTTATSSTVTVKETRQPRRKNGSISLLGRAGMLYPYGESFRVKTINYNWDAMTSTYDTVYNEGNTFGMEFGVAYDVNYVIVEGTMGFDGSRDLYFNIGGEYVFENILGQSDFCPYVGGEVGVTLVNKASSDFYGSSQDELEKDSDGFSGGLRVGILLFRNHSIKFMPEIRGINVFNKDWDNGIRATIGMMINFF